jgi:para-nitrobenzyl esterase
MSVKRGASLRCSGPGWAVVAPRVYWGMSNLVWTAALVLIALGGCGTTSERADAGPAADQSLDHRADGLRSDSEPPPDGAADGDAKPDTLVANETLVQTSAGWVQGELSADAQLVSFRGIPYALPPVGARRFREPQPHPGWSTPYPALTYSKACRQQTRLVKAADQDEDCLTLNVFKTPGVTKAPVLVFIHGGGFTLGSSRLPVYDGEHWGRQGIVFISFNYRVGIFGFFSHEVLSKDGRKVGNYGLRDQLLALKWIKANAASFGGDPANITIMGSSAGGASVSYWMTSPASSGLFARAIAQSGGGSGAESLIHHKAKVLPNKLNPGYGRGDKMLRDVYDGAQYASKPPCFAQAQSFEAIGDACKLEALLKLSPDDLLATPLGKLHTAPMIDDELVFEHFMRSFEAGKQRPLPLLIGSNGWEASVALATIVATPTKYYFGLNAAELADVYKICDTSTSLLAERVYGDKTFGVPARRLARLHAAAGHRAHLFYFNYVTEGLRSTYTKGAPHTFLNPLTFHTYFYHPALRAAYPPPTAKDQAVAGAHQAYWLDFVRGSSTDGKLRAAGQPDWPSYAAAQAYLLFVNKVGAITLQQQLLQTRFDYIEHHLFDATVPLPSWSDTCP